MQGAIQVLGFTFTFYLLSCAVSKLWPIIGQIFAIDREVPHYNTLAGGDFL